ncbi:RNA-guided endonuclease TnpB family protein [Moorena sp. SIO3I6]|uniref:RNA-guided endonuclease InsQ/TnpB family protein n=1 Tax=Moorena sp. SIO3I6 TaxID=2607831 RepID=UPI0013FB09A8|nr:RNA-guided endonuclease TnpB family protein [Moorena sp. SIO3I6]NEO46804.1 IS200/IS605 family element transposase accessory protein TnpB [Moorena sp. SIO4A3]NEP28167.1 IS200/IS605 family element transposase accessory protein TnpB [Moorena sp. SIO3I6]
MRHQAIKVRIYPSDEQKQILAQHFGCARWWWNYALNQCIETYQTTGKGLTRSALNAMLPKLKKAEETEWLKDCYSQVFQTTTLNLVTAYKNFFQGRSKFPRFKSKKRKQSIQYPQNVKIIDGCLKFPGKVGIVETKLHREITGNIKTVTISMTPSGKYFASILTELEGDNHKPCHDGKIAGLDLGIKDFAIVNDGYKTSKFANPRYYYKHEKNLARKQKKLSKKQKGSKSRNKARKKVARVHEHISNIRQDYLHKLSRKLVDDNQVIVVENLNTKGMVRNHNLAKAISDTGWGMFVNFLSYKLEKEGKVLIEIDRWFPSSKTCSNCFYQVSEMPLDIRFWKCPNCGAHHDRDENAAKNIRAEGIRILQSSGTGDSASGGDVRPKRGRKPTLRQSPVKLEAYTVPNGSV